MHTRTKWFSRMTATVLVASAIAVATGPASHAGGLPLKKLKCGAKVTQSLKLKADVGPCKGDALIISADNLTLDLGGHQVIASDDGDGAGIRTFGPRTNVTIKNGTVKRFVTGVHLSGVSNFVLKGLKVKKSTFRGIGLLNVTDTIIQDSRINRNGFQGIGMQNADGMEIVRNIVKRNGGSGIVSMLSETNYIAENTVKRNKDMGIMTTGSTGILVMYNLATGNGVDGIRINEPTGQFVSENTATNNGFDGDVDDDHGLGIRAAANTPGHSNVATGNDEPEQCDPAYLCS